MKIEIPIPKKVSTNKIYAGTHWTKRKELADLFHQYLLPEKNKHKIKEFPVEITYIFRFKGKLLDCSNCTFMAKMLEDALVGIGLLPDDNPDYVSSIQIYSTDGYEDMVEIHIS
jgi:hypothetical protein|tara:strand:+ start:9532 stop:9873 length:342 start_codon:yes stop_codon:yes gene_type:complete